jgi:hypothetical protein
VPARYVCPSTREHLLYRLSPGYDLGFRREILRQRRSSLFGHRLWGDLPELRHCQPEPGRHPRRQRYSIFDSHDSPVQRRDALLRRRLRRGLSELYQRQPGPSWQPGRERYCFIDQVGRLVSSSQALYGCQLRRSLSGFHQRQCRPAQQHHRERHGLRCQRRGIGRIGRVIDAHAIGQGGVPVF